MLSQPLARRASPVVPMTGSAHAIRWRGEGVSRIEGLSDAVFGFSVTLLVLVLFAVYPLKFLSLAIGAALISGPESIVRYMRLEDLPRVLGLYGLGFFGITIVFSLLYSHALSQRDALGLTELELFDTRGMQRRWRRAALLGATIIAWCGSLLLIGDHFRARDELFTIVWWGGCMLILAGALSQVIGRRRQASARHTFVTEIVARGELPA